MQWWADYLDAQLAQAEKSNSSVGRKRITTPAKTSRVKPRGLVNQPIVTHVRALGPTA
jgi:hypothetical protein